MTCNSIAFPERLGMNTQWIKGLKVIGEAIGQLVLTGSTCINAVKIDRLRPKLLNCTGQAMENNGIIQGTVTEEIFYVNPEERLKFLEKDIPFILKVDLPGLKSKTCSELQTHLLDIDSDYILKPSRQCLPGCLQFLIVLHIKVIASEWTRLNVVTIPSPVKEVKYVS